MTDLETLRHKVKERFDVEIRVVADAAEYETITNQEGVLYYACPFDLNDVGILVENGSPLILVDGKPSEAMLGNILHELAHICINGDVASKEALFLAWTFCVAEELGCVPSWLESNKDFGLGEKDPQGKDLFDEFGWLSLEAQSDYLEEEIAHASAKGLIVNGIAVRTKYEWDPTAPALFEA